MSTKLFLCAALFGMWASAGAVNYTYDEAGRLTKVDYGSGTTITYSYDKAGNLLNRTVTSSSSPASFATVSAADFKAPVAPDALVSGFGQGLATATQQAASLPLPTTLGQTQVRFKDAAGTVNLVRLLLVSPTQFNFLTPPAAAVGPASVSVLNGTSVVASGTVQVEKVAPGLFTTNGIAAAEIVRVKGDGTQTVEFVVQRDAGGNLVPVPIDFGAASNHLFLTLFGTGIRGNSGLASVSLIVGSTNIPVTYAGDQMGFAGLDQVNTAELPRSLAGAGQVKVTLTVEGKVATPSALVFK